jgi:hypothetical protein
MPLSSVGEVKFLSFYLDLCWQLWITIPVELTLNQPKKQEEISGLQGKSVKFTVSWFLMPHNSVDGYQRYEVPVYVHTSLYLNIPLSCILLFYPAGGR